MLDPLPVVAQQQALVLDLRLSIPPPYLGIVVVKRHRRSWMEVCK